MTTNYVQFEQDGVPADDRMYDAHVMLDRLAAFYHDAGGSEQDWNDVCGEAWDRATEDDDA